LKYSDGARKKWVVRGHQKGKDGGDVGARVNRLTESAKVLWRVTDGTQNGGHVGGTHGVGTNGTGGLERGKSNPVIEASRDGIKAKVTGTATGALSGLQKD